MDAMEQRARERYKNEKDPVQREAYALAERAGFDWYHMESSARRMAEHAAEEILRLRERNTDADPDGDIVALVNETL